MQARAYSKAVSHLAVRAVFLTPVPRTLTEPRSKATTTSTERTRKRLSGLAEVIDDVTYYNLKINIMITKKRGL
jgi:hypothetical protein